MNKSQELISAIEEDLPLPVLFIVNNMVDATEAMLKDTVKLSKFAKSGKTGDLDIKAIEKSLTSLKKLLDSESAKV
jgi:hypothetical protein